MIEGDGAPGITVLGTSQFHDKSLLESFQVERERIQRSSARNHRYLFESSLVHCVHLGFQIGENIRGKSDRMLFISELSYENEIR